MALALVTCFVVGAAAAGDSLTLRLAVDSEGPAAYNRCLLELRPECPDLHPVLVQIDREMLVTSTSNPEGKSSRLYEVSFWSDSGNLLSKRELWGPNNYGDYFDVRVSANRSQLVTRRSGWTTDSQAFYGGSGETLFTVTGTDVLDDAGGRYLRLYRNEEGVPYSDHAVLCDSRGKILARIPGRFLDFDAYGSVARDTTIVLQADSWILVYGPRGNLLQQIKSSMTASTALSTDSRWLAFANRGSVTACELGTGQTWTNSFADALVLDSLERANVHPPGFFVQPEVTVRPDGRVAVCRRHTSDHWRSQVRSYNNTGRELLPATEVGPQTVQHIGWSGDNILAMGPGGIAVIGTDGTQKVLRIDTEKGDQLRVSGSYVAVLGDRRYRLYKLER